jgi:UDP-N-acetyl-D-glucosamine dehydrogenase
VAELVRDALRNMGQHRRRRGALLGASYREDVGDTRYSGSELVVRKLTEMGAEMRVHDPYVEALVGAGKAGQLPAPATRWARFFRNQELWPTCASEGPGRGAQGRRRRHLAVRHRPTWTSTPTRSSRCRPAVAVIDCFGILDDAKIRRYFELGCEVKGLGRGHVKRIKP